MILLVERTAEAGYDDAPVFMDGKLVPGIGGGICQVSSTLFNSALLAGMDIVERTPHFAPVGYMAAGRDATVAYGYLDFIFKNPYDHPIYVLAHTSGDTLTISILGFAADEPQAVSITVGNEQTIPNKVETRIDPSVTKETTTEVMQALVWIRRYTLRIKTAEPKLTPLTPPMIR